MNYWIFPNWENSIPASAFIKDKNLEKIEKFQTRSWRQILGAKVRLSSGAIEVIAQVMSFELRIKEVIAQGMSFELRIKEVIAQVMPFELRIKDLCTREYVWVMEKTESSPQSLRKGSIPCPLEHMKILSKEWIKETNGRIIFPQYNSVADIMRNLLMSTELTYSRMNKFATPNQDLLPRSIKEKKLSITSWMQREIHSCFYL